jgi:hypothetical protein
MNYTLIQILSLPVLVICVVQLLLIPRVCSLCRFLIINELLWAKSTTITDGNGKVVTPTKNAVGFIDRFLLLPLKFIIWSLRGLLAGELYGSTINPVVILICVSLGAVVGGAVSVALYVYQWHGKPAHMLLEFRH